MKKSISIFFYLVFLLLAYSKSLKSINSEIKIQKFNQIDFKDKNEILNDEEISINIKKEDNQKIIEIGKKGTLYFKTDYNDNETNIFNSSDIEEKTIFQTSFTEINSSDIYNITCRLWKSTNKNLRLFCQLKEILSNDYHYIIINNSTFNYGKYKIFINFHIENITINQSDYFPFLYSDEQIINIDDEKDSYHLIFSIESYNNEMLFIGGKFLNTKILDNCKIRKKELICKIKKDDLIEILPKNGGNLFLYFYWPDMQKILQYPNVFNITVNIKNLKKEDIYIGIDKLLENNFEEDNFVPFETNITNISNLITEGAQCKLGENNFTCFLRKDLDKPLLMLCTGFKEGIYSLNELIKEEIILDNINVKYNFKIQPTNSTDELEINDHGDYIVFAYPKILDFTIKNEYTIYLLIMKSSIYYNKNLKFAPDLEDISCYYFTFTINSEYFEHNPSGYYNLYHRSLNTYLIYYELPPFEVILPKSKTINIKIKGNKEFIKIGEKGTFYFETNYNDSERNIFNSSDIEEKTKFEAMIYDDKKSDLIYCRLWKPSCEKIKIICNYNKFDLNLQNFFLEKVSFNYNEYIIKISLGEKLNLYKEDYEIPLLYSDRQIIDIKDNIESYHLKFKIGTYNDELIYLYGEVDNYLILYNCEKNDNELNCEITKEKLEEILVKNNEQFRVGAINFNEGLVNFISVLNITINYNIN